MNISKKEFDKNKKFWSGIAQKNNWYYEPFFIQVWVNKNGEVVNSVSVIGLDKDYVLDAVRDEEILDYKIV